LYVNEKLVVTDAIEDLTCHCTFRNTIPSSKALEEISSNRSSRYGLDVVGACLGLFNKKGFKIEG
jgi:hypothetical protein